MNVDMASTKYDNDVRQLTSIAGIYGLHQLIQEPTPITDKSSTLLDLIYNLIDLSKGHNSIIYKSFKTFNRSDFRNDICNHNWEFLNLIEDPNQLWSEWKKKFLLIVDKHALIRSKRIRSKNPPLDFF